MRKRGAYAVLADAAPFMACTLSFTAFAEEERTPVGKIKLNFTSDIRAGEIGGNADMSLGDGECSTESVGTVNEGDNWISGDKPEVEIWLSADSDYYFKKSGKNAFSFSGDMVKCVSGPAKNDKEEMVLVIRLDRLDEDDENLDVDDPIWDEDDEVAHWNDMSLAKNYEVRLCQRGGNPYEDGIGATYTVKENNHDFSGRFPKAGTYYFKVRTMGSRNNAGEWRESPYIEITEEDLTRVNDQWPRGNRGWWHQKGDGAYMSNGWQYTNYKWYFFDQEEYMKTGQIFWGDKLYYCDPSGATLVFAATPDGFTVGADGTRVN